MFTSKIASNTFAARPDIIRFQRLAILRESAMNCISNSGTAAPSSVDDRVHQFEVSKDEDGAGHGEMANICFTAIHSCTLRHLRHLVTLPRTGGRVHRLSAWTELRRVHLFEHEREIKDEFHHNPVTNYHTSPLVYANTDSSHRGFAVEPRQLLLRVTRLRVDGLSIVRIFEIPLAARNLPTLTFQLHRHRVALVIQRGHL